MSSSNWALLAHDRDMSPDRNNRYQLDNVGLQLGLGLPLQLVGVSLVEDFNGTCFNGNRRTRMEKLKSNNDQQNNSVGKPNGNGIQQTIDGIPIRKVYITNISIELLHSDIYQIFGKYGTIKNVYLSVTRNDPYKQFAFVTYEDPKHAAEVMAQHRFTDSVGRTMYVTAADSWHQPKEGPDGTVVWKVNPRAQTTQEEDSEDDEGHTTEAEVLEAEEVTEGSLNVLNDDCLLHIFSFLTYKEITAVERVCKRWQGLSFRLWRCLHSLSYTRPTFTGMVETTPALEQYLRRCGESLIELDLAVTIHSFNETTLAVVAKYCSKLECLRVTNVFVGNRSLAHLGYRCSNLKQFVMDDCSICNDQELMSLLPKCRQLTHLEFTHLKGITGKCLASIKGPISSLSLCHCPSIETNYLINALQRVSATLQSLTLIACGTLRVSEVERFVAAVPDLKSLSFGRCCFAQFDTTPLTSIGRLTKLTSLNLHLNTAVDDTGLTAIVDGCEQLTTLNLSGCGGGCAGLLSGLGVSLVSRLRKLTDLDISYLKATDDIVLKALATRGARLKRLICHGCPEITDEGTVQVIAMCNDLELFDLSGCGSVSDATVTAATTSVKMRTNSVPLKLVVGGTSVQILDPKHEASLLSLDFSDYSKEHLRPDFIDDMFFPPSDSEDEEDLDHLCERIGCDCDFEFDDLYDPTLYPYDFVDETTKYGAYDDTDENFQEYGDEEDLDYEAWND